MPFGLSIPPRTTDVGRGKNITKVTAGLQAFRAQQTKWKAAQSTPYFPPNSMGGSTSPQLGSGAPGTGYTFDQFIEMLGPNSQAMDEDDMSDAYSDYLKGVSPFGWGQTQAGIDAQDDAGDTWGGSYGLVVTPAVQIARYHGKIRKPT